MCGIAGIIDSKNEIEYNIFETMGKTMVHRGPDDNGVYLSKNKKTGLISNRLSIIDLSPHGHQPITTIDNRFTIVHNGEVYNYKQIREELGVKGYKFKSNADTEVILYAYAEWGKDCLKKFRGMYAFAIWDELEKRLFLVRDRLGIKPLYYAKINSTFLFASELKTLTISNYISRNINPASLVGYLMMGSVPCPFTIYKDIEALEPGHYLIWRKGKLTVSKYYDLPYKINSISNRGEALESLKNLLLESVKLRMISDVPLGAFLSGGLDSSVVVSLMRKVTSGSICTCSIMFREKDYNENFYAREVARSFNTEHYEKLITWEDIKKEWDKIIWAMDQPSIDGINTYFVSKTAREIGLKVALSGLGGDELFGGYSATFYNMPRLMSILSTVKKIPRGTSMAKSIIKMFYKNQKYRKLSDAFSYTPSLETAYLVMRGVFSPGEVRSLISPEIWDEAIKSFDPLVHISERVYSSNPYFLKSESCFNWVSRAELKIYTHHQLLRDTDVMSMAHSLEVRVPLLDNKLVDYVLCLDEKFKKNKNRPKSLLVEAAGENLPRIVKERKDKQGFVFPFDTWLKNESRDFFKKRLSNTSILNKNFTNKLFYDYINGKVHWSKIWSLIILNQWLKINK